VVRSRGWIRPFQSGRRVRVVLPDRRRRFKRFKTEMRGGKGGETVAHLILIVGGKMKQRGGRV
jgi:hypothetical protein